MNKTTRFGAGDRANADALSVESPDTEGRRISGRKRKSPGGGKLARSEVVTVRLDPRLRFGADLVARKQRRTVSSFIEWAVDQALDAAVITRRSEKGEERWTARDAMENLWDVEEADRFVALASTFPELLSYDEQVLWKLICENGSLWEGAWGKDGFWKWEPTPSKLKRERLREHWNTFNQVADGTLPKDRLPDWKRVREEGD